MTNTNKTNETKTKPVKEPKSSTTKKNAPIVEKEEKVAEVEKETKNSQLDEIMLALQSLRNENEELKKKLETVEAVKTVAEPVATTPNINDQWIPIINMYDNSNGISTAIECNGRVIKLGRIGSRALVRYNEFEEIANNYASFFERGVIVVGKEFANYAIARGLPYEGQESIKVDKEILKKLTSFTYPDIKNLWDVCNENEKSAILSHCQREYLEGNADYANVEFVKNMNRISDDGLKDILDDIKNKG